MKRKTNLIRCPQMRLFSIVFFVLCTVSDSALFAQGDDEHSARWRVKTLSDSDTIFVRFDTIVRSSVKEQNLLPSAEVSSGTRRLASETTVYEITAWLLGIKRELDGDYHLVVQDTDTTSQMIFELPNPDRPEVMATSRAVLYRAAKDLIDSLTFGTQRLLLERYLEQPILLKFTGVGFYDTWHLIPQAGMPANKRELHPILSVKRVE